MGLLIVASSSILLLANVPEQILSLSWDSIWKESVLFFVMLLVFGSVARLKCTRMMMRVGRIPCKGDRFRNSVVGR